MLDLHPGTGGSNPFLSSSESANFRSLSGGSFPRLIRSGPIPTGGFEEGEFKADSPTAEVAAQVCVRGADAVQLRAQEIDEGAKIGIVVQRNPLGVHEIGWQRLRRAGGPVEIEPFGHDEDRQRSGVAARVRRFAHDRLEADRRLRIRIGRALVLGDSERLERAKEIAVLPARYHADETTEAQPGLEGVGASERRAQQNQEAVEETVVLDEI